MRKAFRHTGVLMMLGVVALGLVGAAYTLWYENLTLTANVSTGTLDADWSCEEFQTTGGAPHNPNAPDGGGVDNDTDCTGATRPVWSNGTGDPLTWNQFSTELASKAPTCGINIPGTNIDGNTSNTVGDANQLNLTLGGLYPYAGCEFSVDIHSDGTVPIHFAVTAASFTPSGQTSQSQADDLWDALRFEMLNDGNPDNPQCQALWDAIQQKATNPNGPAVVVNNAPAANTPLQLHYSDELVCNFRVWLAQQNVEGLSGTLSATIQAHQWNEAANPAATTTNP